MLHHGTLYILLTLGMTGMVLEHKCETVGQYDFAYCVPAQNIFSILIKNYHCGNGWKGEREVLTLGPPAPSAPGNPRLPGAPCQTNTFNQSLAHSSVSVKVNVLLKSLSFPF